MSEILIGLRFRKGQAQTIRNVSASLNERGLTQPLSLFAKAEEAALSGEPLQVRCENAEEAQKLAATFTVFGIARPAIEPLGGTPTA